MNKIDKQFNLVKSNILIIILFLAEKKLFFNTLCIWNLIWEN